MNAAGYIVPKIVVTLLLFSAVYTPAIVATAMLFPVVVLFVGFAIHFYKTLAHHRFTMFKDAFTELEKMAKNDGRY